MGERPERFIIYCDDLSFDEGESGYKALKSILDGTIAQASDNVLICATSNRRHLLPEQMKDNLGARHDDNGELHPGEVVEEKISLSERFGLWISFYPFSQREYLAIVGQWLRHFGVDEAAIRRRAARAGLGAGARLALRAGGSAVRADLPAGPRRRRRARNDPGRRPGRAGPCLSRSSSRARRTCPSGCRSGRGGRAGRRDADGAAVSC